MSITITPSAPVEAPTGITEDSLNAAIAEAEAAADAREGKTSGDPADTPQEAPKDETPKAVKPAYIEDKFWDAEKGEIRTEALAKSYSELQKTNSQPKPKDGDPKPEEQEAPKDEVEAVGHAVKAAGFDFDAIRAEYAEAGAVNPETLSKLQKAFGEQIVNDYFSNLRVAESAASTQYTNTVQSAVGGAEAWNSMAQWASENVPAAELETFNRAVTSGDAAVAALAAKGLYAQFVENGGKAPNLVNGGRTATQSNSGYASIEQMGAALSDPRYRADPAFRREVDAKCELSTGLMR